MLTKNKIMAFVPSRDTKVARAFYENILGLRVLSEDSFAVVLDTNGSTIRIAKTDEFEPAPFTIVGWDVPDIEAAIRELQSKGVSFIRYGFLEQDGLGIWNAPGGTKIAWFKDPDGNVLSLAQF
jgi:catechol 2,3-dioxygenase-like lactoylglutathione lyase family enzyme